VARLSKKEKTQCITRPKSFDDNLKIIRDPRTEPYFWNVSTGLGELTTAIQSDLEQIQHLLRQIAAALQR
jgi:hypothetical protein